jgi:hypothetical protein
MAGQRLRCPLINTITFSPLCVTSGTNLTSLFERVIVHMKVNESKQNK